MVDREKPISSRSRVKNSFPPSAMSTVGLSDIPYDVLVLFFTHLEGNRHALYASCLASRGLREAAQESLYRHVQLDYYAKVRYIINILRLN